MNSQIKYCLDANVLITAYNELYPQDLFPGTWKLLARKEQQIVFLKTIFDEIDPYSGNDRDLQANQRKEKYPLRYWLETNNFSTRKTDGETNQIALQLEHDYQTKEHGQGANKNDILLIAFAQRYNYTVVTLEANQLQTPRKKSNCKIPLICREEDVSCINFVELLRGLSNP